CTRQVISVCTKASWAGERANERSPPVYVSGYTLSNHFSRRRKRCRDCGRSREPGPLRLTTSLFQSGDSEDKTAMNAPGKHKNTRIHDVALAAEVSIGTVSRTLNNRPGVSHTTRAKVLAAVERLGYKPDRAARELSNRRPITVGLSTAYGHRRLIPYFMLFLEHLMEELATSGLRLKDVPTGKDGLPAEPTDACMLFGAHADDPRIADLQKRKVPFVLIGRREGVRCVAADDIEGGKLAAEHLLRLNHKNALHVTGDLHSQVMGDRTTAFVSAYNDAEAPRPRILETDDLSALGAYRAMTRDLANQPATALDYTAVFAATD